ncbi:hypothetical protein GU930_19215 [Pantoea vagans]|nr:hypothetical protein [Pantoea vagans]
MVSLNRSQHELELAAELLADIELSRLSGESLMLKAARLARLCGTDEFRSWVGYEIKGYYSDVDLSLRYMSRTGRWIDREAKSGYWTPLAGIESNINTQKLKLESMVTPNISGLANALLVTREHNTLKAQIANYVNTFTTIRSRVLGILHDFVTQIYYEKELDNLAESIFEKYKSEVDSLLIEHSGEVIRQIPSVINRLSDGDEEAVSQALTTVRRIIDNFADSLYPPCEGTYEIGGNHLSLDASRHLNRLNVFVHQRINSKSRKDKIRQNLANLYARVSSGVHADVSIEEAKSLFLNAYLLLGEILHIAKIPAAKPDNAVN